MPPPSAPITIVDPSELMDEEDILEEKITLMSIAIIIPDAFEAIKWCARRRLIKNSLLCETCNVPCGLLTCTQQSDGKMWCCRLCKERTSIRKGSWFERSSLQVQNILLITYYWINQMSQETICYEAKISTDTAMDRFAYCRRVCQEYLDNNPIEIGGRDIDGKPRVVEIGVTVIKSKDCRSNSNDGTLVFGGVERGSGGKKCFLVEVPDKTEDTLRAVTCKCVLSGSHVVTDSWEAYKNVNEWAGRIYTHSSLSNNRGFVDPVDRDIHIQNIKSLWSRLKSELELRGASQNLSSRLQEFIWRSSLRHKDNAFAHFILLLCVS